MIDAFSICVVGCDCSGTKRNARFDRGNSMTVLQKLLWLCALSFFSLYSYAADTLVLCDSVTSELKGESQAPGATNCIDVSSWSWGVSESVSIGGSGGAGAGKPSFSAFSLQKFVDSSSTSLFSLLVKGATLTGVLEFRDYGSCVSACTSPTPYFTVDMTKPIVTAQSIGGSSDGRPTESVSFEYQIVKICYRTQDAEGMLGTPTCVTYNLTTAVTS
jgi:type VI secretion system secreted protein Hcp